MQLFQSKQTFLSLSSKLSFLSTTAPPKRLLWTERSTRIMTYQSASYMPRMFSNVSGTVNITFVEGDEEKKVKAEIGQTVLDVAQENGIEIEGACEGELACSTCHCILEKDLYDQLPKKQEEEDDMLDMAWGLTETSRLGCQVKVEAFFEGAKIIVPQED